MAPMVLRMASLAVMGNFIKSEVTARPLSSGTHDVDLVADLAAVQVFPAGARASAEVKKVTGTKAETDAKAKDAEMLERALAEAKAIGKAKQAKAKASEAKAKAGEEAKAHEEAEARARVQKEFDEQLAKALADLRFDKEAGALADLKAEAEADDKAKVEAEAKAKAVTKAKAKAEAKTKAKKEKIRAEAEARARAEAEAKAKAEAEAKAKAKKEKARTEAEAKARLEAKAKAKAAEQPAKQLDTRSQRDSRQHESMAYGDPHMQNVLGQRFDLMQPGSHTLVQIPRFATDSQEELFRVQAGVHRVGRACADMYILTLNVTGRWVEARRHRSGLHFSAGEPTDRKGTNWMRFGSTLGHLDWKVVHGRTPTGTRYLNFFVRHLGEVGYRVGGLLGEDDHTAAAKPDSQCKNVLVLLEGMSTRRSQRARSVAEADLL